MTPQVLPFGDGAFLVEVADLDQARTLAAAIEQARHAGAAPGGGGEILTGFDSVVVRVDPLVAVDDDFESWLTDLVARSHDVPPGAAAGWPGRSEAGSGRPLDIPVAFDGPDLDAVADTIGASPSAVVDRLTGGPLEVALLGFAPGFPYLVGLPPDLAAVPRRPSPRPSVAAGSVAIGGGFASVYPQPSPGGWMVLGRTSTRLFDPERPPFARLLPGHRVQFSVVRQTIRRPAPEAGAIPVPSAGRRPALVASGERHVEVVEPGLLTLVQDTGRRGVAALGVPGAGPADPESMWLANRLVGNRDGAACIEATARGPTLRFHHRAHVAVVASAADGVDVHIDGHPVGPDLVMPVEPGQTVAVGRVRVGLRAYLAVAGGIETPLVVGSRSSDLLSRLGPGPLAAGDRLGLGVPGRPHGQLSRPTPELDDGPALIRVVLGPHRFTPAAHDALCSTEWSVAADSNRIGLRLEGDPLLTSGRPQVTSTGMVTGAVQVPPDGNPIILMVDHATLGGYPVIAGVISADLARLGQLRPGDRLVLSPVSRTCARRLHQTRARALAESVSGWFPTTAAT